MSHRDRPLWTPATAALICVLSVSATPAAAAPDDNSTCSITQLPGLSAQYARALRASGTGGDAGDSYRSLTPAAASDFWRVATSVLRLEADGEPQRWSRPSADHSAAVPTLAALPCDQHVRARDRTAWSMAMLGYSAREIADVLDGHLTLMAVQQAYARTMAGEPRESVAAFLEAQWRGAVHHAVTARAVPRCGSGARPPKTVLADLAGNIAALAQQHRVSPALIRAVIDAESSGNPCAVSPAGAIGLMQLMPATAAALGVDPWHPLENLRGGIAYLASMLRTYGENTRLALIAYNAGPQHADSVKAGRAVAYRETRRYLGAVAARYPF